MHIVHGAAAKIRFVADALAVDAVYCAMSAISALTPAASKRTIQNIANARASCDPEMETIPQPFFARGFAIDRPVRISLRAGNPIRSSSNIECINTRQWITVANA